MLNEQEHMKVLQQKILMSRNPDEISSLLDQLERSVTNLYHVCLRY